MTKEAGWGGWVFVESKKEPLTHRNYRSKENGDKSLCLGVKNNEGIFQTKAEEERNNG